MSPSAKFVGREKELALLRGLLERALKGEGSLALIEGEAGVGKTRLVTELAAEARERGFTFLQGRCTEGSGPYFPFVSAFSDTSTVEGLLLIYRDGRVIAHWSRRADFAADAEVVSGMLSAIQDFITQSFRTGQAGALREIKHGDLELVVEHGASVFLVAMVSGPRPLGLPQEMRQVLEAVQARYSAALEKWDGAVDRFSGVEELLAELVALRRYGIEQLSGLREEFEGSRGARADKDRERMFENVSRHITSICSERPLLLFLDDIQWMDPASLHLLHHIARATRASPAVILCTCRSEDLEAGGTVVRVLRELGRERLLTRIELGRLDPGSVREMVGGILGKPLSHLPEDFLERLYAESEGNPFFVEELLRSLLEEGVLDPSRPDWSSSASVRSIKIPSSVEDIVLGRLERLDERDRELLGLAAVAGHQFELELLSMVSGVDEIGLASALERMTRLGLVTEDLRFGHAMIREVLYKRLPPFKLTVAHRRVGFALEELHRSNPREVCSALAIHFSKGNVPVKAIEYSMMAAEVARVKYAHDEALGHCRNALSFVERLENRNSPEMMAKELAILMKLAQLCEVTADVEGWMEYSRRAVGLATSLNEPKALASAHISLGNLYVRLGEWPSALMHYGRSSEVSAAVGDMAGLAIANREIGNVHFRVGDYPKAIEYHQKSIELARGIEPAAGTPILIQTYIELANVHAERGECELAVDYYQKAMDLGIRINSLYDVATAFNNIGDVYLKTGEWDYAREYFERALHIFKRLGNVMDIVVTLCNLAEAHARALETSEARAYCEEAMKYLKRLGEVELPFQLHMVFAIIHRHERQWDKSREHFEASIAALEGANMPYYLGVVYHEMGLMHRERGDAREARRCLENALQLFDRVGATRPSAVVREELKSLGD
ncbi:MAG: tetratricopeptide repeat protein [Thermoplasmata archaeon]